MKVGSSRGREQLKALLDSRSLSLSIDDYLDKIGGIIEDDRLPAGKISPMVIEWVTQRYDTLIAEAQRGVVKRILDSPLLYGFDFAGLTLFLGNPDGETSISLSDTLRQKYASLPSEKLVNLESVWKKSLAAISKEKYLQGDSNPGIVTAPNVLKGADVTAYSFPLMLHDSMVGVLNIHEGAGVVLSDEQRDAISYVLRHLDTAFKAVKGEKAEQLRRLEKRSRETLDLCDQVERCFAVMEKDSLDGVSDYFSGVWLPHLPEIGECSLQFQDCEYVVGAQPLYETLLENTRCFCEKRQDAGVAVEGESGIMSLAMKFFTAGLLREKLVKEFAHMTENVPRASTMMTIGEQGNYALHETLHRLYVGTNVDIDAMLLKHPFVGGEYLAAGLDDCVTSPKEFGLFIRDHPLHTVWAANRVLEYFDDSSTTARPHKDFANDDILFTLSNNAESIALFTLEDLRLQQEGVSGFARRVQVLTKMSDAGYDDLLPYLRR